MGNSGGIKENENNMNINMNEIIENDCYEEIDLSKINKIKQREKNWNENSIIYSNNDLNLKEIFEDKNNNQKEKENEKKVEDKNANNEIYNKVIEEQKNEDESEDVKDKKANENGKNNSKLNENNNNEEKEKEKKEIKEEPKEEPKEEKKEEPKEKEKEKEENNNNDNIANTKDNNNNNINDQQAEKNNNINNENKVGENKDKTNVNNNKIEEEKNNKVENKANGTQKNDKKVLKVKNLKPKIRPKNTSDAALCRSLNASPTHSHQGQNKPSFQTKKENNEQQNNKSTQNNSPKNINQNNDQNNNNKNEEKPEDKGANNQLVEKKEPEEEFDIKNIISEYRLNHLKDDEIIFSGTLDKILKIPEKNTITYSQRFCIFTKNYFAYYKSKESYISLNKPMLVINNKLIIRIENTSLDGDNYYFGIICVVNDETKDIIKKVNSFVTTEGNICELLLGFRTKQYENMMKWVIILRYFISKQNE